MISENKITYVEFSFSYVLNIAEPKIYVNLLWLCQTQISTA